MTDTQKQSLRQQAANFLAAVTTILPNAKSANVSINVDAAQVNIQLQSTDSSVPSGTAVEVTSMACKFLDLPAAQ